MNAEVAADAEAPAAAEPDAGPPSGVRRAWWAAPTEHPLAAVLIVQGLWLWWAFSRGWFLQADISNLADGAKRPLGWSYLTEPLGGHFQPINRLVYWLLDEAFRLDYSATVVFRVAGQLVATALLYRILVELVGRRPLVTGILAVYALNPVVLGGGAWFTSGTGLIPAQAFGLGAVLAFLGYDRTRKLPRAALTGLLLALTVLAADQWIVTAPAVVLLAVVHLYEGSPRRRADTLLRQWRGWLLIVAPLAVAVAGLLHYGVSTGVSRLTVGQAYRLLRDSWLKTVGPTWVGGPWRWVNGPGIYVSFTGPPGWMVLLGQLGVAVIVLVGVRRRGVASLAAWLMPVACFAIGVLLIGIGRYSTYGNLLAVTPRYLHQAPCFFAIGAALALAPRVRPGGIEDDSSAPAPARRRTDRFQQLLAVGLTGAAIVVALVSGARFAQPLGRSPVRDYMANLETSARTYGSSVNVWDTPLSQDVVTSIEPSHRISDALRLARVPARFDDPSSEPLVVTPDGHLAKAAFVATTEGVGGSGACGTYVHGKGSWTIRLDHPARSAEWFLRLELYQAQPSDVRISVLDGAGHSVTPLSGGAVHLGRLEARNLPLPLFAPSSVRITSATADTSLCLVHVLVGGPFPAGG